MSKRQATLGAFGFTKKVTHRGKTAKVEISNYSMNEDSLKIPCPHCDRMFVNQQGLTVHLKCVHPSPHFASDFSQRLLEEPAIESVVRGVLTRTINIVAREVDKSAVEVVAVVKPKEDVPKKVSLRGQSHNKRRSYTAAFKLEVIQESESGRNNDEIAQEYGINRTLVIKWVSDKCKIGSAAESEIKKHLKIRPARKYKELYAELLKVFKEARKKGHRIDFNWIWSKARIIRRKMTNEPNAIVRKHVVQNFVKRNNIRMRAKQRNKSLHKSEYAQKLREWHATTRERLVRTGFGDNYHDKWGRFTLEQRLNVDQSPCPFALNMKRTYEITEKGVDQHKEKVWISQPGSGLDKRQCSLQVCVRPKGTQPRLGIIFRGKGLRISDAERNSYHKGVDVFFQENAWADTKFSINWVGKTLAPIVENLDRYVLFCDNLTSQTQDSFKSAVSGQSGVVWYGMPKGTDLWQPVDAGYVQLLKVLMRHQFESWLDDDEHADRWYANENPFTATGRRVMISHWAGDAYNKLCSSRYDQLRWNIFEKTGCLITSDGSDDHLIKPEGLHDYSVPPPSLFVQPSSNNPVAATVEPTEMPLDVDCNEDEEAEEGDQQNDDDEPDEPLDDKEEDRVYQDEFNLVGRQLKALYSNGWFTGDVLYFNSALKCNLMTEVQITLSPVT